MTGTQFVHAMFFKVHRGFLPSQELRPITHTALHVLEPADFSDCHLIDSINNICLVAMHSLLTMWASLPKQIAFKTRGPKSHPYPPPDSHLRILGLSQGTE